jgi:hypothetical protein
MSYWALLRIVRTFLSRLPYVIPLTIYDMATPGRVKEMAIDISNSENLVHAYLKL